MQEFNRGILYTLRELYNQDTANLPRKTVSRLLDYVLRDEEEAEADALAGMELLMEQAAGGSVTRQRVLPAGSETTRKYAEADVRTVRQYARELRDADPDLGATTLIRMIMEHFGFSQTTMSRLLGINQGWLSSYLREGKRGNAVMAALATLCGD